jgi:hypothetical protein
MRTVFNSNDQFANVFASQTQFNGRTNSMFFERDTAYSYGRHYIAAKFMIADNGEKVCFINKNPYSNSTAKHCQKLWNAIPDGIKVFRLSFGSWIDRDNLPELIKKEVREIERLLSKQLTARTYFHYAGRAVQLFNDVNEICTLFGLQKIYTCDFKNWVAAINKATWIEIQTTNKGAI